MNWLLRLIFICVVFAACSTPQKQPEPIVVQVVTPKLDLEEVQRNLGVEMGAGQTGFREKSFDACFLGSALKDLKAPLPDCHHAYFTLLQFQLSCRGSEESSAVLTESDLRPLSRQKLIWKLGKMDGESFSDADGNGSIRAISSTSQRKSYLRISTGTDFLMMKSAEVTAIVTPPSWCQSH